MSKTAPTIIAFAALMLAAPVPSSAMVEVVPTFAEAAGSDAARFALPGSRVRYEVLISNDQDSDLDGLKITLSVPAGLQAPLLAADIGLESSSSAALSLSYGGPEEAADDVEFSFDGGETFVAAGGGKEIDSITHVRLLPQGKVQPGKSATGFVFMTLRN